jgi:predicted nucleic acid-binding protein
LTRVAFDTNVLVYAELEPGTDKGALAGLLIERASIYQAIIPAQVLGEFLAVIRRKRRELFPGACELVIELTSLFKIAETNATVMRSAIQLAQRHRLQLWDAVICAASLEAGAAYLLSEDMQDGSTYAGMMIINPFMAANRAELDRLLPELG